jgi:hypothetical protein
MLAHERVIAMRLTSVVFFGNQPRDGKVIRSPRNSDRGITVIELDVTAKRLHPITHL